MDRFPDCAAAPMQNPLVLAVALQHEPVLIAGGGDAATIRAGLMLQAGARVTVISPEVTPMLRGWISEQRVTWIARGWQPADIDRHAVLIFAATNSEVVNRTIVTTARRLGKLVCSIDASCPGNFTTKPAATARSEATSARAAAATTTQSGPQSGPLNESERPNESHARKRGETPSRLLRARTD